MSSADGHSSHSDSLPVLAKCDKSAASGALSKSGFVEEEPAIVQSAVSGDEVAFERLYQQHRKRIFSVCLQYSNGDRDQAADLCQEAFITAFFELSRLRDRSRFIGWLTEIAKHKGLSFIRKQRRVTRILKEYEVLNPAMTSNRQRWTETELRLIEELSQSISKPDVKETVRLFYFENKRTADIAAAQGITQTAVTTRLNRFRTALRKRFTQELLKDDEEKK